MREIKFRGKDINTGKWSYGSLITCEQYTDIWTVAEDDVVARIEVDPETVGQFTGYFDSNGKEIYEGDILEDSQLSYETCWYDDLSGFIAEDVASGRPFLIADLNEYKVRIIGNIHDTHN